MQCRTPRILLAAALLLAPFMQPESGSAYAQKEKKEYFLQLADGKRIKMPAAYAENCVRCHHADGCGRGLDVYDNEKERFKGGLRPAGLGCPAYSHMPGSREPVYRAIEEGIGSMPAFPHITEREKREIFDFIRELGKITGEHIHH